jgi:Protein of unknown function (DUF3500)
MKSFRLLAAVVIVAALGGVAYFAGEEAPLGSKMADAAEQFLGSLSEEQKAKCTFAFDDKERVNWIFVPVQDKELKPGRKGLRLEEMSEKQRQTVLDLLKTGTSESGYQQAVTIMSLETILHDLEKSGAMVRNPGWYFLSIFGKPARTGKWGWRIEGHHLSLNFTIVDGEVASATPAFFGANPAEIKTGDRKGQRTLKDVEDAARELFASLDDEQKKTALQSKHFGEPTQYAPAEKIGTPVGLAGDKMNAKQKGLLEQLLKVYVARMPKAIADAQWKKVADGGFDSVYFAYTGGLKDGEPHTYRVQGASFIVQFLNAQEDAQRNKANHIHSAWRELPSDFAIR